MMSRSPIDGDSPEIRERLETTAHAWRPAATCSRRKPLDEQALEHRLRARCDRERHEPGSAGNQVFLLTNVFQTARSSASSAAVGSHSPAGGVRAHLLRLRRTRDHRDDRLRREQRRRSPPRAASAPCASPTRAAARRGRDPLADSRDRAAACPARAARRASPCRSAARSRAGSTG